MGGESLSGEDAAKVSARLSTDAGCHDYAHAHDTGEDCKG